MTEIPQKLPPSASVRMAETRGLGGNRRISEIPETPGEAALEEEYFLIFSNWRSGDQADREKTGLEKALPEKLKSRIRLSVELDFTAAGDTVFHVVGSGTDQSLAAQADLREELEKVGIRSDVGKRMMF